jgi:hypothetical protein
MLSDSGGWILATDDEQTRYVEQMNIFHTNIPENEILVGLNI